MDNPTTNAQQALLEKLKDSTNILVTVSNNPSVDQLAACLGLTIWLNKIDKHATAVFSGEVPSTIEFLQPAETLEKNTDSLRDFIIALDKSKADKLRYKVEDSVVKIFITPYRTSLSADDLEFSQGDFNVDMVIALGVTNQEDIDNAITAHGRILHDATVATVNVTNPSELGTVNWFDNQASSLCELVVELGDSLDKAKLDGQIATALLTGVVAETDRFSNEKTTPQTMNVSAQLMGAGANQQLIASKLEEPAPEPEPVAEPEPEQPAAEEEAPAATVSNDGTLEIDHQGEPAPEEQAPAEDFSLPPVVDEAPELPPAEPEESTPEPEEEADNTRGNKMITEPPALGGTLTANSRPDDIMGESTSDPLSQAATERPQILGHDTPVAEEPAPEVPTPPPAPEFPQPVDVPQPAPPDWMPPQPWMDQPPVPASPADDDTLEDIERSVNSPHIANAPVDDTEPTPDLNSARDEVLKAINSVPAPTSEPIQALNAQPMDLSGPNDIQPPVAEPPAAPSLAFDPNKFEMMNDTELQTPPPAPVPTPAPDLVDPNEPVAPELTGPIEQPYTMPLPGTMTPPPPAPQQQADTPDDPNAPPPVPPPLMPPGFPPAR